MAGDSLIGREVAGYRIEALIGRGGMGVVYRAEHTLLGRRDALKVLAPDLAEDAGFRERFLRESRLAAAIEHPSIIPIYHAGEADGLLYIAMRYVDGIDLRALLKREGPLDPSRTIALLGQVGGALDTAHASGLVHRDVKPANILIAPDDRVYLSDFGIAKQTATRGLTKTGSFVGTLDYAAPEQIEGKELDGRADVYSLACVLCECLTGAVPYQKDSEVQVLYAHLLEPPPVLTARRPELGQEVDTVIATALAKSRDERYGSCQRLLAALSHALAAEPSASLPPPAAPPTRAAPRKQMTPPSPAPTPARPTPAPPEPWTPPPESEPSSAAPSFPSGAAPAAKPRGLGIWLLAAAVALVAVAALAAVLLTQGGSNNARGAAVERLLDRVPASLRNGCHSRPGLPEGATAAVLCTPGGKRASYFAFAGQGSMNRYYDAQWRGAGISRNSGNCGDLPFRGERPYSLGGRRGGRVFCATNGGGTAALVGWTDPRSRIYVRASRSDGNQAALLSWWSGAAGPLAPKAAKVAKRSARLAPGTVVYRDAFAAKSSGWQTEGKTLGYANGRYRIVPRANQRVVSLAGRLLEPPSFRNVELQVTARGISGPYSAGLVCRFGPIGASPTYYALQARGDGLLRIEKISRMKSRVLRSRPTGHPLGHARLLAACSGGGARPVALRLSVNGGKPLTFRDRSRVIGGAVGVVAQSGSVPGMAIEFDNFVVKSAAAPK